MHHFFDELLSYQNVNVARFARNAMLNATFWVIIKHCAKDLKMNPYSLTVC